ncbi:MAG: CHAP domain-containing protein [Agromyces sp.]
MTVHDEDPSLGEQRPMTRRAALAAERGLVSSDEVRAGSAPERGRSERTVTAGHAISPKRRADRAVGRVRSSLSQSVSARTAAADRFRLVKGIAGLSLVAGLFATVAIPAYSLNADGSLFASSDMFTSSQRNAQTVDVSQLAAGQAATTDGYSSESAAQVAASRIQAIRLAGGYIPPFQSAGDDYPFWNKATEAYGGGLSPLGYYYRECVDFVAWRLNRDVGSTSAPWRYTWYNLASGSAYMWYSAWQSNGWPTSSIPVPGAVAWFPYNHVAYVKSINADGSVNLEEYNWTGNHLYHTRTIAASDAVYLYPPG